MLDRRTDIWLPAYSLGAADRLLGRFRRRNQLTHIIFLVCDHFEPRNKISNEQQAFDRVNTWHSEYLRLQNRCRDAYGTVPVHSFFYPPHHGIEHLARLSDMVFDGLGELELHYHHHGDTEASFRKAFGETVAEYKRWGFLLEEGDEPRTSFGFIHGDWALNNSCNEKFCGVNDELTVLEEFGCWGDLTMPSGGVCQTKKINSIYYATSNPETPKGHDTGVDARAGVSDPSGMLMIQGPLGVNWGAPGHPRLENASLTTENWGRADRIRKWIECNIHVKGRPDWQFVKLHTHGALEQDFDGLFGEKAFAMHRMLNEQYNDGKSYRIHYVTARQAYNLIKAAENGKDGDPSQWLDYLVKPQPHSYYTVNARHELRSCTATRIQIADIESNEKTVLRSRVGSVRNVTGPLGSLAIDAKSGIVRIGSTQGRMDLKIELTEGTVVTGVSGATLSESAGANGLRALAFIETECEIRYRVD